LSRWRAGPKNRRDRAAKVYEFLDDEVCYWQREAIERRLGASYLKPAGILVRSMTTITSSAGKLRSASSIAFDRVGVTDPGLNVVARCQWGA
jgi:hypothetical protein